MSEGRHIGYICYNQADEHYQREIQKHLAYYKSQRHIICWDKSQVQPGRDWQQERALALATARAAILLISADFFADPTIMNDEIPALLEAANQKQLTLFILQVSACLALEDSELHQFRPINTVPLRSQTQAQQQEVLASLAQSIAHALSPSVVATQPTSLSIHQQTTQVSPPAHKPQRSKLPATGQSFLSRKERYRLYEIIEARIDGSSTRNIKTFLTDHQVPKDITGRINPHQGSLDIAQEIVSFLEKRGEQSKNFHTLGSFLNSLLDDDPDNYSLGVELTSLIFRHSLILDQATLKHLGKHFQVPLPSEL